MASHRAKLFASVLIVVIFAIVSVRAWKPTVSLEDMGLDPQKLADLTTPLQLVPNNYKAAPADAPEEAAAEEATEADASLIESQASSSAIASLSVITPANKAAGKPQKVTDELVYKTMLEVLPEVSEALKTDVDAPVALEEEEALASEALNDDHPSEAINFLEVENKISPQAAQAIAALAEVEAEVNSEAEVETEAENDGNTKPGYEAGNWGGPHVGPGGALGAYWLGGGYAKENYPGPYIPGVPLFHPANNFNPFYVKPSVLRFNPYVPYSFGVSSPEFSAYYNGQVHPMIAHTYAPGPADAGTEVHTTTTIQALLEADAEADADAEAEIESHIEATAEADAELDADADAEAEAEAETEDPIKRAVAFKPAPFQPTGKPGQIAGGEGALNAKVVSEYPDPITVVPDTQIAEVLEEQETDAARQMKQQKFYDIYSKEAGYNADIPEEWNRIKNYHPRVMFREPHYKPEVVNIFEAPKSLGRDTNPLNGKALDAVLNAEPIAYPVNEVDHNRRFVARQVPKGKSLLQTSTRLQAIEAQKQRIMLDNGQLTGISKRIAETGGFEPQWKESSEDDM